MHLYIFLKDFVSATVLRSFLSNLLPLFKLKYDTEIFQNKQDRKRSETGKISKGNFINLPYFKKSERIALNIDGTKFSLKICESHTS